jgi:hypothetical protein
MNARNQIFILPIVENENSCRRFGRIMT